MTKWELYSVTEQEYAKADKDWSYSPIEEKIGEIEAENEVEAKQILKKLVLSGKVKIGTQLVEVVK